MTIRDALIGCIIANIAVVAVMVGYLVYDIVTAIRERKEKRENNAGKEE